MNEAPSKRSAIFLLIRWLVIIVSVAILTLVLLVVALLVFPLSQSGKVQDEAMLAHRSAESLPGSDIDYFHDMDGGIPLTPAEAAGRNNWIVWTGGNDRFWDLISVKSVGTLDFLKTLSSRPGLPANRNNRWEYLGLINEPCYQQATGPDPETIRTVA